MSAMVSNVHMLPTARLPEPMVPADADLRDFPSMLLDVVRLRDSDIMGHEDPEVFRMGVLSWCVAWHQLPAGSLPDDDVKLARLMGFGRDVNAWKAMRARGGLWGWKLCSDGRLYHPVVAEKVREAVQSRRDRKLQTEAARAARAAKRGTSSDHPHQQTTEKPQNRTSDTDPETENDTSSATSNETESKVREGKRREEKKKENPPTPRKRGRKNAVREYTLDFEEFWDLFPRDRRDDKAKTFDVWTDALASGVSREAIMEALEEDIEKKWRPKNFQFVKASFRWLEMQPWLRNSVLEAKPAPAPTANPGPLFGDRP